MLDPKFIRENHEQIRKNLKKRNSSLDLDRFLVLDEQRRKFIVEIDTLRAVHNQMSDKIAQLTGEEQKEEIEKMKSAKDELKIKEEKLSACEKEYHQLLCEFPNILADDVPIGPDESGNQVLRSWGTPRSFNFDIQDHVELGKRLDIIDIQRAATVSGSRFAYVKGKLALLQFALIQYVFSIVTNQEVLKKIASQAGLDVSPKPFIPIIPPVFIKPEVYAQMARLEPKEERYYIQSDDLYLIGSAEHTLGPLHKDEILDELQLPLRYIGYSTSFRREAGSYGKDTRGILRVHQFDKLEFESFSLKEHSFQEQDFFVAIQEYLVQSLNIPYRVMMICTGDMGTPDARQIDIECWIPSQKTYRETHTSDCMTDYQSRRLNTRVRRSSGIEHVHMNDATVFAMGRILLALCENYQTREGTIEIPEVLRPFTGFDYIT